MLDVNNENLSSESTEKKLNEENEKKPLKSSEKEKVVDDEKEVLSEIKVEDEEGIEKDMQERKYWRLKYLPSEGEDWFLAAWKKPGKKRWTYDILDF